MEEIGENSSVHASLKTDRLVLQPITLSHAEFYLQLMNSPGWLKFIGDRKIYSVEQCAEYLETRMLPQWKEKGYGNYIAYRKTDNVPVGAIGIFSRPGLDTVDLGFAMMDEYMGQGYTYEGANRLLQEASRTFALSKIQAITDPQNVPCQRLLEKLGFAYQGNIILPNEVKETRLYSLTLST